MEVMWAAQSQAVNFQAEYFLGNRYQRIDFQIPDRGWRLDGAGLIEELIHLGKERAAETFARLEPEFFTNPAPRFVPF